MSYCSNCGALLTEGMRFCPNCGAKLQIAVVNTASPVSMIDKTRTDYRIILVDRGTCSKTHAKELLMDVFGYTSAEALSILDNLPAEIAVNLNFQQASYASQALSEYGMQISVQNGIGYMDLGQYASSSVYDNKGSFLSSVLSVLATLGVVNKVSTIRRYQTPINYSQQYHPVYRRSAPPVHIRRTVGRPVAAPKPFAPAPISKPAPISPKPQRAPIAPPPPQVTTRPPQITPLNQMKPGPFKPGNGRGGKR